jgi:hypothetical protein
MTADIFISRTEGGGVEVSVIKRGLSSGPAQKYNAVEQAEEVLLALGFDAELVNRQLNTLADMPPSTLLKFPEMEINTETLRTLGFTAAAFQAA